MENVPINQPGTTGRWSSSDLHPLVYKGMIGFALWFIIAVWGLFSGSGYILLTLGVVTWLLLLTVVLMSTLARIGRRRRRRTDDEVLARRTSFRDWAYGDFGLWGGRIKGWSAAVEVFVPLAAVVIGITLFGIIKDLVVS